MRHQFIGMLYTICIFYCNTNYSQNKSKYFCSKIVFYNVENLFDTIDNPVKIDNAYLPSNGWNTKKYLSKIKSISQIIPTIGDTITQIPADIIGLCEIENKRVLTDLIQHPNLKKYHYDFIHHESLDIRGIDVALLFRKSSFVVTNVQSHQLILQTPSSKSEKKPNKKFTRDQLLVSGKLHGKPIHFIIIHWPSRSKGKKTSEPYRIQAANLTRNILKNTSQSFPNQPIIVMGDFNDNPNDKSINTLLSLKENLIITNPFTQAFKNSFGTIAYRDSWHLFDQIILFNIKNNNWTHWKSGIYNNVSLINENGKFKGYPKRFKNSEIGYSDHFPVFMYLLYLIKE